MESMLFNLANENLSEQSKIKFCIGIENERTGLYSHVQTVVVCRYLKKAKNSRSYAKCPKGKEYAINEMTDPRRSIATTVRTIFKECPVLPVRQRGYPQGQDFCSYGNY